MCKSGCCKKSIWCTLAWVLVIIGGLNWGLVAIGTFLGSNWNVVNLILGSIPVLEGIVYLLVGISAISMLLCGGKCCKKGSCGDGSCAGGTCSVDGKCCCADGSCVACKSEGGEKTM